MSREEYVNDCIARSLNKMKNKCDSILALYEENLSRGIKIEGLFDKYKVEHSRMLAFRDGAQMCGARVEMSAETGKWIAEKSS